MTRRRSVVALAVTVLVGAAVACASTPGNAPRPIAGVHAAGSGDGEPALTASAPDAPPVQPSSTPSEPPPSFLPNSTFASWTEKNAVDDLAHDCTYGGASGDPPVPAQCTLPYEQACVYDPCHDVEETCRQTCSTSCASCDQKCVTTCGACEAACSDDACRLECGKRTGACKQASVEAVDKCSTATCARKAKACYPAEVRKWKA